MSLRARQKVKYHTIGYDQLKHLMELPRPAQRVFSSLLEHIDKKDNCLQMSYSEFVRSSELSSDVIKKGLKALIGADMIRKDIIDIYNVSRYMVNPLAAWSYCGAEFKFAQKVYQLGSHEKAWKMRKVEKKIAGGISPTTGELFTTTGHEWRATEVWSIVQQEILEAA